MFCIKERPLYCRYGPCQFYGRSKETCPNDEFWKRSCGSPRSPIKLKAEEVRATLRSLRSLKEQITEPMPLLERKPSSSCLKSPTVTPPESPSSPKKSVRFADALGMELEAVRLYEKCDADYELNLPESFMKSVYRSRRFLANVSNVSNKLPVEKYLEPCFIREEDVLQRVNEGGVCLEEFVVDGLSLKATVRVSNISMEKAVKTRFTINDWTTHYDLPARHTEHCGDTDKFCFEISLPKDFLLGCRVEFAVCYDVGGSTYWDNNRGENYAFECADRHQGTKL